MSTELDLGNLCLSCLCSTKAGSGSFVNRVPSDSRWTIITADNLRITTDVVGYLCADCFDEGEQP